MMMRAKSLVGTHAIVPANHDIVNQADPGHPAK